MFIIDNINIPSLHVTVAAYFFPLKWSMTASMKPPTVQMNSIQLMSSDQSRNSIRVTSFLRGEESRAALKAAEQRSRSNVKTFGVCRHVQIYHTVKISSTIKFPADALPNRAV